MLIIYCSFLMQGMSLVQRRNPWGRKAEMLVNKCCLSSFKVSKFSQPLLYFKRVGEWGGGGGLCIFLLFYNAACGLLHRFFTIFNLNFRRQVFLGFSPSKAWWLFCNWISTCDLSMSLMSTVPGCQWLHISRAGDINGIEKGQGRSFLLLHD